MPKLRRKQLPNDGTSVAGHLTIRAYRNGALVRKTAAYPNKVVNSDGYGRNLIARQLKGDTTYGIAIDSVSFGDDDTAATDSDTGLGNATVTDVPLTDITVSGSTVNIDVFVADANLPTGTYKEIGYFIGDQLFSRVVFAD